MSEIVKKAESTQMDSGSQPISITYGGEQMTKPELIAYLYEVTRYKKEFEVYEQRKKEREKQIQALATEMQCKRTFPLPYREPPRGLALLSSRKKKEYQRWLDETPKREEEKKRKEEEENKRIAGLREQYNKISGEALQDSGQMLAEAKKFEELMLRQVIAPDYREGDIPQRLLMYLFNGRANTLAEAINVYHDEEYRMEMKMLAIQQQEEAKAAMQRQLSIAWQQLETQREQAENLAAIAKSSEETRKAAKDAEFWLWLDYISK
jgi:hypothetical protein